jgi:hypothetical protein
MAMLMYRWHALKLEGVHRAVAQPCVDEIRHSIFNLNNKINYIHHVERMEAERIQKH